MARRDSRLGRVLDHLRRLGLYDRMPIIVTSDQGEQLGEWNGEFYDYHGRTRFEEMRTSASRARGRWAASNESLGHPKVADPVPCASSRKSVTEN